MHAAAILSLKLSHFRSHRASEVAPGQRSVALVGPNGAGKTNVLEAVSLLSPGRGLRLAKAEELARRPEGIGWRLLAEVMSRDGWHEVEIRTEGQGRRKVLIDGKARPQLALARLVRILWLVPAMDRLWTESAEGRRRFLDRAVMSLFPDHGPAVLAYEKTLRERNRLLREGVDDPAWHEALEAEMARHGAVVMARRQEALDLIAAALDEMTETHFPRPALSLVPVEGELLSTNEDLRLALWQNRVRDLAAGRTLFGPHRVDLEAVYAARQMPARLCSTGEQKALLVSFVLANARAVMSRTGQPPVLLLDEIAAHLDPERRAALFAEIVALGAQAWMTGTDAAVFDAFPEEILRLFVHADVSGSRIVPLEEDG